MWRPVTVFGLIWPVMVYRVALRVDEFPDGRGGRFVAQVSHSRVDRVQGLGVWAHAGIEQHRVPGLMNRALRESNP